ncbi:LacI family DNA-binding transcriptional regulator [Streptomyces sp. NPDC090493]|uniref:LacI family DNA-binding transcriptional regulator n=1 Tax=Streptomyces sp. NPDC090493 TaxID=3365964 RepID=UPI0037FBF3A2
MAKLAGVSQQTVSRVARGGGSVRADTAARVNQAIEALGYRPDPVARALSTGTSRVLGVLSHASTFFGTVSILSGIEQAAERVGYGISMASLSEFSPGGVQESIDRLTLSGCDGIVLIAPWASDVESLRSLQSRVPLVTTSQVPGYDGPAVHPDAVLSAGELTDHLLSLGHETVWHVAGPQGWNAADLRAQGWEQALRSAGAQVPEMLRSDWTARSGYEAGRLLAAQPEVTAVFAANDETALGVIYALSEAGLRVPEDVSVVGYDDAPGSAYFRPALTTVSGDYLEHGRQAVSQLMRQLAGEEVAGSVIVGHKLIVRQSTARRRS